MIKRAVFCLLLLAGAARAADGPTYKVLPAGRYSLLVHGMICTVSARAIEAEWTKLPEVEKAEMNFDRMTGTVTVRLDRTLKVSHLRRALKRAAKTTNLGERYELDDIRYVP